MFEGVDFNANITRLKFDELCGELFRATIDPIDRVLRNAKVDKNKVTPYVQRHAQGQAHRRSMKNTNAYTINPVLSLEQVTKVVLVGGSTRIPKIQSLVSDYFQGVEILQNIGADVCIATGAAIQASYIANAASDKVQVTAAVLISACIEHVSSSAACACYIHLLLLDL